MSIERYETWTRYIIRIKVPFYFLRLCFGYDTRGSTPGYYNTLTHWHMRITRNAYVCFGSY